MMPTYEPSNKEIRDSAPKRCTCGERLGRPTFGDPWGNPHKKEWFWYVTHDTPGEARPKASIGCDLVWCGIAWGLDAVKYESTSLRLGTPAGLKSKLAEREKWLEKERLVVEQDHEFREWLKTERKTNDE